MSSHPASVSTRRRRIRRGPRQSLPPLQAQTAYKRRRCQPPCRFRGAVQISQPHHRHHCSPNLIATGRKWSRFSICKVSGRQISSWLHSAVDIARRKKTCDLQCILMQGSHYRGWTFTFVNIEDHFQINNVVILDRSDKNEINIAALVATRRTRIVAANSGPFNTLTAIRSGLTPSPSSTASSSENSISSIPRARERSSATSSPIFNADTFSNKLTSKEFFMYFLNQ